ncbi:30S ribosomal protein S18, partial [Trifolium medium]|nr:30S ribosomal protein S18 [Trifolium medium]
MHFQNTVYIVVKKSLSLKKREEEEFYKKLAAMASEQQESKTISLKILVDKQSNKVVFVETTNDFVDTLFSFLSLPLATIFHLLATNNINNDQQQPSESSPFLANINNLYQTVQNTTSNDVWNNPVCKEMLLHPMNPCESQCMKLFLNVNEPSSKFYVCTSCYKFTTFQNLHCACGKPINGQPKNLDSKGQGNNSQNGVFVRENGSMFLVSDDLKIVPSSSVTYLQLLMELEHSDSTQLEEVTHNIGKQEILNLLKYSLTSHEPLTNTILKSSSKNKGNPHNPSAAAAVKVVPCSSKKSKMDVKVVQSKSQKKMIFTEANGDFVDFIFSFLTIPLGSIVKLLGANSFAGCVGNLYKSVENLDPMSVLLNPGIAPQFGYPNQPLNIPHVEHPAYYY